MKRNKKYRTGTVYKLFFGRIYCIQTLNWIGNWINIFESVSEKEWETEIQKMREKGIIFENEK